MTFFEYFFFFFLNIRMIKLSGSKSHEVLTQIESVSLKLCQYLLGFKVKKQQQTANYNIEEWKVAFCG